MSHEKINNCVICNKLLIIKNNKKRKPITCSRSCASKLGILRGGPNYIKRISELALKTKNKIGIDGLTGHQRGALNTAKTIKKKYTKYIRSQQISNGHKKSKILKEKKLKNRIIRLINYFGLYKFVILFYEYHCNCKKHQLKNFRYFKKCIAYICIISDNIIEKNIIIELFVTKIRKIKLNKICLYCDKNFKSYDLKGNCFKIHNKKYCSKSCASKANWTLNKRKNLSEKMIKRYLNSKEKEKTSIRSKTMWKTRDSKIWVKKYLNTLGELGIKRRALNAKKTKINKGIILDYSKIDISKYNNYKKIVRSITNKQNLNLLNNYKNRGHITYHLDHIFPISKGFAYNIPPELIGNIKNIQIIKYKDNLIKNNHIQYIPEHILYYIKYNNLNNEYKDIINEINKNK